MCVREPRAGINEEYISACASVAISYPDEEGSYKFIMLPKS